MIIDNMPISGGLVNAGGQATIPESNFWEMENAATGLDGRVYKRPGLRQWGQTLKSPDAGGVGVVESFSDLSHFDISESVNVPLVTSSGSLVFRSLDADAGNSSTVVARNFQPNDGTWDTANKVTLRMLFKANTALPAQSATTNQDYGPSVAVRTDTTTQYVFLFLSGAIYYYNGTSFVPSSANVDDGRLHIVQFDITGTTTATITVDDGTPVAVTVAGFSGYGLNNRRFYLAATTVETSTYEFAVDFVQVRSGNDGINGVPVTALFDWSSQDPDRKHLLAVAGNTIYDDAGQAGRWQVLDTTPPGSLTTFATWLGELLIVNPQQALRRWTGSGFPKEEPLVLPKRVYAATSHQSRVCVVSEDKPLTVYVSAADDISDWTTEDVVSPSGESFFLNIPDAKGRRVVGMQGDFFGQLVIWTEESAFTLQGSSIDTYVLQRISQATGLVGPRAFDMASKDMLFASSRGFHSLATVIQYGDMAASDAAAVLRNLWQRDNQFGLRKIVNDSRSTVTHAPELGRTYLAVRQQGDSRPASIYEYNHDTQRWSGPWGVECEAARFVLLGVPGTPVLLVGDTAGRVCTVDSDRRSDRGSASYDFRLRSGRIDGRTIDPGLRRRDKHWNRLRLFVLPRAAEGLELSFTADGHKRTDTATVTQNLYNEGLLDTTFFLDQSSIVAAEKMAVVTYLIDMRSKWLEFEVASTSLDGDAVIVGWQIDFSAAQDSKENA